MSARLSVRLACAGWIVVVAATVVVPLQIDLDALHTQVLSVVTDTVQPSHATLWLRSPER